MKFPNPPKRRNGSPTNTSTVTVEADNGRSSSLMFSHHFAEVGGALVVASDSPVGLSAAGPLRDRLFRSIVLITHKMKEFDLIINNYLRAKQELVAAMQSKHKGLERYAQGEKAKQSVIDIGNREIQAVYDYLEVSALLVESLNEENERLQRECHRTLNASTTIKRLQGELKKAQQYIVDNGLDPYLWRWT